MATGSANTQNYRNALTVKAFKQFNFDAAHQLPDWPGIHGHSYVAEVWFEGPATDGYVVPESVLTQQLESIRRTLDHSNLNDLMEMPTSENIARFIWKALSDCDALIKVRVLRGSIGFGVEYTRDDAKQEGLASS